MEPLLSALFIDLHQLMTDSIKDKCLRTTRPFLFLNRYLFHREQWLELILSKVYSSEIDVTPLLCSSIKDCRGGQAG
jgi:hypothetical protein